LDSLLTAVPGAHLNGHPTQRLPNNLSLSVDGLEPLALVRALRDRVSFSASSACATEKIQTSHVLTAMFGDTARARGAFRIAPGRFTGDPEAREALESIVAEVSRLRATARSAA
jgi:cysteine desulfurase